MKIIKFLLVFILGLFSGLILGYFIFSSTTPFQESTTFSKKSSLPEINSKNYQTEIPILMYHHVAEGANSLFVSPSNFEEQMSYLYAKDYQTISLDELFEKPPEKKFIITFDDGYKDIIKNAEPILKRLGFKATVFLIVNDIGKEGYLNWEDIEILKKEGWSFGSHTLTHHDLTKLKKDEAENEIVLSKEKLESKLENPVDFFCYPAGKFNQDIIELVKRADYKGAVTTLFGKDNKKEDIYQLKRIRVSGSDTLHSFIEKLGKGL
jgi:peptidoglycan/xylan/chitin deacetylase (PgdA/CDA1 family)